MRTPAWIAIAALVAGLLGACTSSGGAPRSAAPPTTGMQPTAPHDTSRPGAPLAGVVVGIDPGHDGRNWSDPSFIDRLVFNGREWESCDTTGTATDGGYTEAQFNWNVAVDARRMLQALGARVVLTRASNDGVGPCITARALRLDRAHVDVAFDIHADGGPPGGRGFTILVPVEDRWNHAVIRPSLRLARELRRAFRPITGMPWSTYDGTDAIQPRDDLAGLNLTTVPKVLIECGNMRNAVDAAMLITPAFQRHAAWAIVRTVAAFEGRVVR